MQDFKKLRVWKESLALYRDVVHSCDRRRYSRYPGKRSQTIRAADSIPTNVAEGSAKSGREFARYLEMALASAKELESHLIFARDEKLFSIRRFSWLNDRLEYVRRMLIKLLRKVREDH